MKFRISNVCVTNTTTRIFYFIIISITNNYKLNFTFYNRINLLSHSLSLSLHLFLSFHFLLSFLPLVFVFSSFLPFPPLSFSLSFLLFNSLSRSVVSWFAFRFFSFLHNSFFLPFSPYLVPFLSFSHLALAFLAAPTRT